MRTNKSAKSYVDSRMDEDTRLAGGEGLMAAKQTPEALLRRAVMTCLLWDDIFYSTGEDVAENIKKLIPQVSPEKVYDIAIEAKLVQKLRHAPLFIAVCMSETGGEYRKLVSKLLPQIINRADELAEMLALYWKDGKKPIGKQVKVGLANSFLKFNEYSLAKYNRDNKIKLRDVMFMVHPKPITREQEVLFKKLADDELAIPDTWEVALSSGANKKETWERLITENKLGGLAFLRNLRNMEEAMVDRGIIKMGFEKINPRWLLPINYLKAASAAPRWMSEIENLMFKGYASQEKLPGKTILVVDVSGSMNMYNRINIASAMTMMAREVCEEVVIYATAGNDFRRIHETELVAPVRGFALPVAIMEKVVKLGGGGIFTRQALEFIEAEERGEADRIIVFSDSQDCDIVNKVPKPFGKTNYIVDVSSESHGVNYNGIWTAEISGWSEYFIPFIFALEGRGINVGEDE